METKKYRFTGETMEYDGIILHRIQALKDFDDVKTGDKGGFIQYKENLSQEGNCWIYDDSIAMGSTWIERDAKVRRKSIICNSVISESANIIESYIFAGSNVYGRTLVISSKVGGNSILDCVQIKSSNILNLKCQKGTIINESTLTTNSMMWFTGLNMEKNEIILGDEKNICIQLRGDGSIASYYDKLV